MFPSNGTVTATVYSIDANGQERYDTVMRERVAEVIKRRQNQGVLEVRVVSV